MQDPSNIYVFGDQTLDVLKNLQGLLLSESALVTEFLDGSFRILRREISQLPSSKKQEFPLPETLGLLLEAAQDRKRRHPALDSAFVIIYEIAYYVHLLVSTNRQHPPPAPVFLGFCTGSFAAASIACANTLLDIPRLGIQAVAVAFRVGYQVHQRAGASGYVEGESWSAVVSNIQHIKEAGLEEAVDRFCNEEALAPLSKPYISAIAPNSATITGPPRVLERLLLFPGLSQLKPTLVPIKGPYHCSQAYSESDIEQILDSVLSGLKFLDHVAVLPCLSCAPSQTVADKPTLECLLRTFASEALTKQMRIDNTIEDLSKLPAAKLIPINTQMLPTLVSGMRHRGKVVGTEETVPLPIQPNPDSDARKIAIVGYSGRFPEADGVAELWDLLQKGLDVVKPVPADRFDGEAHHDPTGKRKNTSRVNHGCWIREPGLFDARFFQVSPREASQMDPAQRLALLTAYEAMEMAGFVADRTTSTRRDRVGVYFGTTSDDWREINNGQNIDTYFIPGGIRAFIPGRINYFFKLSGPSISVDTACSSSLAAINIAVTSLLNGDCDSAIAGGTNILTNPDNFAGLDRGHFLSRTGNCKTFDNEADGYCRADGVGTVVLKRLSDAVADKDPIFGVIMGAATNHSAEAVSITRPLADAQEYILKRLLNKTHVKPHEVSYIEMHGTGTQAGDAVEMQSILNTFAWDHSRGASADKSLHLGSVKSNLGHGESASGVTALIKVLLMMQKSKIPPHCGIKGIINQRFPKDLSQRGVHIALTETDWKRPRGGSRKRRAFVNNFSAAGGNTALLLEDAPDLAAVDSTDRRSHHVVVVSARSAKSLMANLAALSRYTEDSESTQHLSQISYTTTARRLHHQLRLAFVAKDLQDLRRQLSEATANKTMDRPKQTSAKTSRVGFLFTGQGAQETGMARALFQDFSSFRSDILSFEAVVISQGFPSILPLINGSISVDELSPTVVQLGTCVIQMALALLWINWGVKPQYITGHSLGEYAALHIAGVLSVSDAIWLCGRRAMLMEEKCNAGTHCMLAVKASTEELSPVIAGTKMEIACINGPQDTVLSGPNPDADAISTKLEDLKYKSTRLALPFAFHSSQVEPLLEEFEQVASRVTFHTPKVPFVSTLLGRAVHSVNDFESGKYLVRQCRESVDFLGAVQSGQASGLIKPEDLCIEIGAHPLLSRMMTAIVGDAHGKIHCYPSLRRSEDAFKTISGSLSALYSAGVALDWNEYHRDFPFCQKVVDLPTYSWDLERCWIQYENNWCLTKGDATLSTAPTSAPPVATPRLSSSVQRILEQVVDDHHARIVIQSDLHEPELAQAAQEHVVSGLALCSSSLYADIAHTLAKHLAKARYPEEEKFIDPDVCNMAATRSLVVRGDEEPQLIEAVMAIDWASGRGSMSIASVDDAGQRIASHATCDIVFQDRRDWIEGWARNSYLIQRSIQQLRRGVDLSLADRFGRGMAYKLFSTLMRYGPSYQGMQEVVFDSSGLEATAQVRLQPTKGTYGLNPCWIDSFGHLAGFVMNANNSLDLAEHVYVNHGWAHMRCSEPFMPDASYQTYVRMQRLEEDKDTAYAGDVYVLRDGKIVTVYERVQFNKLPRRVLSMMQPSNPNKSTSHSSHPAAIKKSQVPKVAEQVVAATAAATQKGYSQETPIFTQVLQIISDEMGTNFEKLPDDACFIDYGLDSLMGLTVLGAFRESLALDVPASLFEDCPSKKELRDFLAPTAPATSSRSSVGDSDEDASDDSQSGSNGTTSSSVVTPARTPPLNKTEDTARVLLQIVAEEIGVSFKDLRSAEDIADLGLDSLMSLDILGRVREDMGLDLPQDFLQQNSNVASIKDVLRAILGGEDADTDTDADETHADEVTAPDTSATTTSSTYPPGHLGHPASWWRRQQ
ncbi:Conidial yellow pigment biosynthesis polyketide synthase [Apiospora kogelbergensis]|uniref:Conidial yellow pigment biosynthesis polyketide synthase n=1 Tax=Apiospora kogelbergensis TaxID=1337665 RepID=A0AAW0QIH1_9PEZI